MNKNSLKEKILGISGKTAEEIKLINDKISMVYRVDCPDDQTYLLKVYNIPQTSGNPLGVLAQYIKYKLFVEGLPISSRKRLELTTNEERVGVEGKVLQSWEDLGIDAPRFIGTDNSSSLMTEFIEGENYAKIISEGRYSREHHSALITNLRQIRELASTTRDPLVLHNDLEIENFMYDEISGKSKAIDPGLPLDPNLSFDDTDAYLNLMFCYSLLSRNFIPVPNTEVSSVILKDFMKMLDSLMKERMLGLNKSASPLYVVMQSLRDPASGIWWGTFSRNKFDIVNKALRK